jgi:hypothetical protein
MNALLQDIYSNISDILRLKGESNSIDLPIDDGGFMFKDVYLSFKINTHEVTINLRRKKYLTKRSEYKCEVSVIDLMGTIAYSREFDVLEEGYFVKVAKIEESIYSYIENFLFKILYQLPIK